MKTVGIYRKTRFRGVQRVGWGFMLAMAAYNLVRIKKIYTSGAPTWELPHTQAGKAYLQPTK